MSADVGKLRAYEGRLNRALFETVIHLWVMYRVPRISDSALRSRQIITSILPAARRPPVSRLERRAGLQGGRDIWVTAARLDILAALPPKAQLNVESSSFRSEERPCCPRGFLLSIGGTGK